MIAASYWGKFKTVSQMIMTVLLILDIPTLYWLEQAFIWIALALTVISMIDYFAKNIQIVKQGGF